MPADRSIALPTAARGGARRRLPDLGSAEPGPRRRDLSRRSVRRRTDSCSGTTPGTRATTSSPTASCTRRSARCSASGEAGAVAAVAAAALFALLARRRFGDRGAGAVAVVRRRGLDLAAHRPDDVPARAAVRARGDAPDRRSAAGARRRPGGDVQPREPGRRAVRRARRGGPGDRRGAGRAAPGSPSARRCRSSPSTSRFRPGATSRSCSRPSSPSRSSPSACSGWCPAEYRALRIGAVLYAALAVARLRRPERPRRQRHPARGAARRSGAGAGAVAAGPPGRSSRCRFRCSTGSWSRRSATLTRRSAIRRPSAPSTSRCSPSSTGSGDRRARSGSRSRRPRTAGRRPTSHPSYPIARGWLRQLESDDFDLFTDGNLTAGAYLDWLRRHGVSYVAVPDAKLDYMSDDEVALIDRGLAYLVPVWSDSNWRLYRVARRARMEPRRRWGPPRTGPDAFTLTRPRSGALPFSWNRYWDVTAGDACLRETDDGATEVEVRSPGTVTVATPNRRRPVLGIALGARLERRLGRLGLPRWAAEPADRRAQRAPRQPAGRAGARARGRARLRRHGAQRRATRLSRSPPGRWSCSRSAPSTGRWRSAR